MSESIEVRLARIEERQIRSDERMEANHDEIMGNIRPLIVVSKKDHDSIVILKRDRFWIFALAGSAISAAGYALIDRFIGRT